jgi:hypothetical protein
MSDAVQKSDGGRVALGLGSYCYTAGLLRLFLDNSTLSDLVRQKAGSGNKTTPRAVNADKESCPREGSKVVNTEDQPVLTEGIASET